MKNKQTLTISYTLLLMLSVHYTFFADHAITGQIMAGSAGVWSLYQLMKLRKSNSTANEAQVS